MSSYNLKKIQDIFGTEIPRTTLLRAESAGSIPSAQREKTGSVSRRAWTLDEIPAIGELYGFLKKPASSAVVTVFTTKGGVLKTTLTLNLARLAALHNIKTVVVGLDLQGDISTTLGLEGADETATLEEAQAKLNSIHGLYDFDRKEVDLSEIIMKTDVPTLDFIPETPELHQLDRAIGQKNAREQWLSNFVVPKLKEKYDLIVFDCSPNWNNLVSNAIVACDLLISPLECKINNFRNYRSFQMFVEEFKAQLRLQYTHVFVPTRLAPTRTLSKDIQKWYLANVPNCLGTSVREGVRGEESMASYISVPEYAPTSVDGNEMRQLVQELWHYLEHAIKARSHAATVKTERAPEMSM